LAIDIPYNLGLVMASMGGVLAGLLIENLRRSPLNDIKADDVERETP
jgi:hypothetical protein